MVKIYALVNPVTGDPFYVGATCGSLKSRLRKHVLDSYYCSGQDLVWRRNELIRKILSSKLIPEIIYLFSCKRSLVPEIEKCTHLLFSIAGFEMLQCDNMFHYKQK